MSGFVYQFNTPALVGWIFLAVGGVFLLLTYRHHQKGQRLRTQGLHAVGTVLRLEESSSDEHPHPLHPVVQFVTVHHEIIERRHYYGQYPPQYHVGQQIDVFYDPADPGSYVLGTQQRGPEFWVSLGLGSIFALIGLGCLVFA